MNEMSGAHWVVTDAQLRSMPFFSHFLPKSNHIYDGPALLAPLGDSLASAIAGMPYTQYKLLAEAIPSRSFAAGANRINAFDNDSDNLRNHDMQNMQNGWPAERMFDDPAERWLHSDLKDVAYLYVWPLFNRIVQEGDLK